MIPLLTRSYLPSTQNGAQMLCLCMIPELRPRQGGNQRNTVMTDLKLLAEGEAVEHHGVPLVLQRLQDGGD